MENFPSNVALTPGQAIAKSQEGYEYVILRTNTAGCHMGKLISCTPMGETYDCVIADTRRIWSWTGAKTLSHLAAKGSNDHSGCKISIEIPKNRMPAVEVISMTEEGLKSFNEIPFWE